LEWLCTDLSYRGLLIWAVASCIWSFTSFTHHW